MTEINENVAKAAAALEALPPKAKSPSAMMALVDGLYDRITDAIGKGYTYDEIAKTLQDSGVTIKASTLRQYYVEKKRKVEGGDTKKRTRKRRDAAAVPATKMETITLKLPSEDMV